MASLRDVLDHAGKPVRLTPPGGAPREGRALRRGDVALLDPKLEPSPGDRIEFLETGEAYRLESAEAQEALGRVDHYRARLSPAARG